MIVSCKHVTSKCSKKCHFMKCAKLGREARHGFELEKREDLGRETAQFYEALASYNFDQVETLLRVCETYESASHSLTSQDIEVSLDPLLEFFMSSLHRRTEASLFCRVLWMFHSVFSEHIEMAQRLVTSEFVQELLSNLQRLDYDNQSMLLEVVIRLASINAETSAMIYSLLEGILRQMPSDLKVCTIYLWITHSEELKIPLHRRRSASWAVRCIYEMPLCQENIRSIERCLYVIMQLCKGRRVQEMVELKDFQEILVEYLAQDSLSLVDATLKLLLRMADCDIQFCVPLEESLFRFIGLPDIPDAFEIQENACLVMSHYLNQRNSVGLYLKLLEAGICERLSVLMKDGPTNIKVAALSLVNVFSEGPIVATSHLVHFGIIPTIIDMLSMDDPTVTAAVLEILTNMIQVAPRNGTTEHLREIFAEYSPLEHLHALTSVCTDQFAEVYREFEGSA